MYNYFWKGAIEATTLYQSDITIDPRVVRNLEIFGSANKIQ